MKNCLFALLLLAAPCIAIAQQDCITAIPITTNLYTQFSAYIGQGAYTELSPINQGCLGSAEKNDAWYLLHILVADSLTMVITPNNPADDYDFAIYDITNGGCSRIFDYTADTPKVFQPVACNYWGMPGPTGIVSDSALPGFGPSLYVTPGMMLAIIVSNYSSTQNGYTLQFNLPPAPTGVAPIATQGIIVSPVSPNPVAGGRGSVSFTLPAAGSVSCCITGALGQRMGVILANERMAAGSHRIDIPVKELGLAPGTYFFTISDGLHRSVQRFVVGG